ncbi:hypothetical protein CC80DRAFT_490647 [Byssothecium circinans]|uniref:Uncharacterized protein n=1 Tax=Byssothecium circinans TaxID=147558 RepID=A0A6A5UCM8_9PLEO|nr:hypothetical protein CC80DRAFT_490647 [Byssothecium circinans]
MGYLGMLALCVVLMGLHLYYLPFSSDFSADSISSPAREPVHLDQASDISMEQQHLGLRVTK